MWEGVGERVDGADGVQALVVAGDLDVLLVADIGSQLQLLRRHGSGLGHLEGAVAVLEGEPEVVLGRILLHPISDVRIHQAGVERELQG